MLKQRIITAVILLPLMVLAILYLPVGVFCLFTALITLMAAWEWTALMDLKKPAHRFIYLIVMSACFLLMLFISIPLTMMVAAAWWLLALVMVAIYPRLSGWWSKSVVWRGLMGVLTLVPCWMSINYVRNLGNGSFTLLYLFILVWGADTTAYFVGKKWGKTKLAPHVSPGKSVQGFIGALVFAVLAAIVVVYMTDAPDFLWKWLAGLTILTVLSSVVGDLFESMLKRNATVKDSGVLIPGHGGLLDRIDSLTAAAPVFGLGVFFMMMVAY